MALALESSRHIPCAVSLRFADGTWNVPATLRVKLSGFPSGEMHQGPDGPRSPAFLAAVRGRNDSASKKELFQCREFFVRAVYLVPASEAANGFNRRTSASRLSENFLFQTGESK